MIYNETNLTEMFVNPYLQFPNHPITLELVNGNGTLSAGYIPAYCRIENFDLLMQLQIVQTVFMAFILILLTVYVGLYLYRWLYD